MNKENYYSEELGKHFESMAELKTAVAKLWEIGGGNNRKLKRQLQTKGKKKLGQQKYHFKK